MEGLCPLEAHETVRPLAHPPRKVPVAFRDRLKEELDKLVGEEIITPVTEPTKWVFSLVLVNKPNKLRICIDPQDLNKALQRAHHPLPTIEQVAKRLGKARVFSAFDVKNEFWQVLLDKETHLTTFNAPFDRYRRFRLPFGIKTAPEEYQQRIHDPNNMFQSPESQWY